MTSTIEEVDRTLAGWKARLQRIDDNLVALETSPTCMLLEQAGDTGLDGATRARVAPALATMRELFAQRSLLDDVMARATEIRQKLNRLWPADALRDLDALLHGPSITLPPVETPLARRGLLDAAETASAISPDQLLAAMVASFEEARDAVAAVDEAWNRLTIEADRATAETARLEDLAARVGEDAKAPLADIRDGLEAVRARTARDPLGAADAMAAHVSVTLQQLGARLAAADARRRQVEDDVRRAHHVMAEVTATHRRAEDAYARCRAEVVPGSSPPSPADPDRLAGLAQWLDTLDATMAGGRWPAAGVGVTRWLAAAAELLAAEQEAEQASAGPLAERDELRGRLAARRQQAKALAARGRPLDPGLGEAGERADALLRACPVPLADAARAVADYEERLRA